MNWWLRILSISPKSGDSRGTSLTLEGNVESIPGAGSLRLFFRFEKSSRLPDSVEHWQYMLFITASRNSISGGTPNFAKIDGTIFFLGGGVKAEVVDELCEN